MSKIEYVDVKQWRDWRADFDQAVLRTPGILRFCSASSWQLMAAESLYPERERLIARSGDSWQLWAAGPLGGLPEVLQPMEAEWLFGCPVIGPEPGRSFHFFLKLLMDNRHRYPAVLLSGIAPGSLGERLVLSGVARFFHVRRLPGYGCRVASLAGGFAAFLSRRSSRFRRLIRELEEAAEQSGIRECRFQGKGIDVGSLFMRILQLESAAWKEQSGVGIFGQERYRRFYGALLDDLGRQGCLRAVILQRDGIDLAYAVGGVLGSHYRGLQMAYRADTSFSGLGHLAQLRMIRMLAAEGIAEYDLGMDLDYKRRWADRLDSIDNFLLLRK